MNKYTHYDLYFVAQKNLCVMINREYRALDVWVDQEGAMEIHTKSAANIFMMDPNGVKVN